MNFSADARLIEINLNVLGIGDLFASRPARHIFASLAVLTDGDQMIAGNDAGSRCG